MVKRIIWPFHRGDYLVDTRHLTTVEHGAYLMLLMHYWDHAGLPDDDPSLRRITGLSKYQWERMKPTLQAFFHDGWRHKRVDADIVKAGAFSERMSAAAKARWLQPQGAKNLTLLEGQKFIAPKGKNSNEINKNSMPQQCLPSSYKKDKSFLGADASAGSLATALPAGALARQPTRRSQNKFTDRWQVDLAQQFPDPVEFNRAIDTLASNPGVWDRISAAEMREKGSGVLAAMIELRQHASGAT